MKRHIASLLAAVSLLGACTKDRSKPLSKAAIRHQIDSLVGERLPDITLRAEEDLDRRKSIEVKVKADSIVAARTQADTSTRQP